jgi:hypothetical protein
MEGGEGDVLRPAKGDSESVYGRNRLSQLPNSQSLTEGINSILFRSQLYAPVRDYEFGYSKRIVNKVST